MGPEHAACGTAALASHGRRRAGDAPGDPQGWWVSTSGSARPLRMSWPWVLPSRSRQVLSTTSRSQVRRGWWWSSGVATQDHLKSGLNQKLVPPADRISAAGEHDAPSGRQYSRVRIDHSRGL